MTVGIVGLGLIGGSFAKAYHAAGHRVLGCDTDASTLEFSMLSGEVEGPLTDENLSQCDLILIAVYPGHPEGRAEGEEIERFLSSLSRYVYCTAKFCMLNSPNSPYFMIVETKASKKRGG